MEFELQNADEGTELIDKHMDSELRYYNVPRMPVWNEEAVQAEEKAHWESIRPGFGKDMSAVAYFFAAKLREKLKVPIGIIDCYWGGTSITCWMDEIALGRTAQGQRILTDYKEQYGQMTMEQYRKNEEAFYQYCTDWNQKADALRKEKPEITQREINRILGALQWNPPLGPGSGNRPMGLAETMINRVAPAALAGFLFYQGESDAGRIPDYDELLVSAVKRWRELFRDEEMPFLNVQLPMWIAEDGVEDRSWSRIRQLQERAWRLLRNSGMAVIVDCGEYDNLHPTNKRVVGERLCEQAMGVVYGEQSQVSPRAIAKHTQGNTLVVTLTAPVTARGEETLMEIAGQEHQYVQAQVEVNGNKLYLTSAQVPNPTAARYAYVNWGNIRLYGENGLPLAPFVME